MDTTSPPNKSIPANLEAERSVLGALLIDPDAIIKVANFLRPADFFRERHAWIYEAMLGLHERREPIDLVTVIDDLERKEQLAETGGPAYISELINATPSSLYVDTYARIVERTALLRRLIGAAGQIAELAYDESRDVDDVIDKAESIIFGVSEARIHRDLMPIRAVMRNVVDRIDFLSRNQDTLMGVPTGFTMMDRLLGGLQKSDLIILAARPAMGKTSLALNIAQNAAKRYDARVAVFSLEMSNDQLVQRLLSMETGIDSHRLRLGHVHDDEWPILLEAANVLAGANIFVDDTPSASVNEIRTKCRRLYAEHGLDLVVIDYLQLMSGGQGGKGGDNRQQEISYISRSLKGLARELNVPVIALSQLSRAVEGRSDKRPMLSDLRESGCVTGDTLVQMADDGRRVPIRELAGSTGHQVITLNTATWKLEPSNVTAAFCTGTKAVYRLTSRLGRTIQATANHQFLTIHGWKRLDHLTVGDSIALPRILTVDVEATLSPEELALLGHLLGDGCTLPRHAIQYTTREADLAQEVADLATTLFGQRITPRIVRERQWYQVYLSAGERLTHGKRNAIAEWLDGMGAFGLRSHEKFVPEAVFMQPVSGIRTFLKHLWVTDGCIRMTYGKSPRPAVYYATSSRRLAGDVQALLLRIGINARLAPKDQGTKGRVQYHVVISGQDDLMRFIGDIGTTGAYRLRSMDEIIQATAGKKSNTNRDVVPREAWRLLAVPAMEASSLTSRAMQAAMGHEYCGTAIYKTGLSRERAERVAMVVQSPVLAQLASSDVYWDKVESILYTGEEPVFDLTVPGNHNFVANDIVIHNSIEQDADVVLFIYREDYYIEDTDRQNIADIIIAKHRHGSTGTVSLFFRKELTQFRDLEIQRQDLDY